MSHYSNHHDRTGYPPNGHPQHRGQPRGVQAVRTIHSAPLEDADPMGGRGGQESQRHPFEGRGQRVGEWDPYQGGGGHGQGMSSYQPSRTGYRHPFQGGGHGQRMSSHHPSDGGRHSSQRMPPPSRHSSQRHSHVGDRMPPPARSHSNLSRDPSMMTIAEYFQAEAAGLIPSGYGEDAPRQSRHGITHHGGGHRHSSHVGDRMPSRHSHSDSDSDYHSLSESPTAIAQALHRDNPDYSVAEWQRVVERVQGRRRQGGS